MRGCFLVVLLAALPVLADDGENAPPASEGVARLVDALRNSGSYKVRATAAVALGRLGDAQAVAPLAAAIRDDDNYAVRSAAASALGRMQVPEAVRPLLAALHDSDEFVRSEAKGSLQRFFSVPYLGVFREVLRSDDPVARRVAVQAFGEVAREPRGSPPEAAAAVVEALGDDDEGVAQAAEKALADLPHDRALPLLIGGLQGGSSSVRAVCAHILTKRVDKEAVEPLIAVIVDTDQPEEVRRAARTALKRHVEEKYVALDTHLAAASDAAPARQADRLRGLRVLAAAGDPRAVPLIEKALAERDPSVRMVAARAAVDLGGPKARFYLESATTKEADPRAKRQLELLLKSMR